MLNKPEAQKLIIDFIALRKKAKETRSKEDIGAFEKHEELCIKKFEYIVYMGASRYKAFSNYEDLVQEGKEALVRAMKNYDPKKGSFFWWSNRYIQTKIARSANLYTTIRFPLKVAKKLMPRKEANLPLLIEQNNMPDKECERKEDKSIITDLMKVLTEDQQHIINLAYGLNDEPPQSINKICKELGITRTKCINKIEEAMRVLKANIRI